jgi:hypothetical protein
MIISKVSSEHYIQDFIKRIINEIPKSLTVALVDESSFLLPDSVIENILLFE